MKLRSPLAIIGVIAAVAIVVASIVVRQLGPGDSIADTGQQRRAVEAFYDLVIAQDWRAVYEATTEPPTANARAFTQLMADRVDTYGDVTNVEIEDLRLLRSRASPMLEVHEVVTFERGGRERTESTVSYFARRDDRWLFAFSAPR